MANNSQVAGKSLKRPWSARKVPVTNPAINIDSSESSSSDSEPSGNEKAAKRPRLASEASGAAPAEEEEVDPAVAALLARIPTPPEPWTTFEAHQRKPLTREQDPQKKYVIYVPLSFDELNPIFEDPRLDAADVFQRLTGLDRYAFRLVKSEYWPVYLAFMKDFGSSEVRCLPMPGQDGKSEFCRLEFGELVWARGVSHLDKIDWEPFQAAVEKKARAKATGEYVSEDEE